MGNNERITENLVRDELRKLGYYSEDLVVEEQRSNIVEVKRLLAKASKSEKGGPGAPEFIVSSPVITDFLLVIECKAAVRAHKSTSGARPVAFAVDGALHYAKHLAQSFNVIAIGASGQTKNQMKIDCFLHTKGASSPIELKTKNGASITSFLAFNDLVEHASHDPSVERRRTDDLMAFSRDVHDFMRDHAKLTEAEKPLLVSGTLIALKNKPFAASFSTYRPEKLQKQWLSVIREEIEEAQIPQAKKDNMVQPYSSIAVHPELGRSTKQFPKGVLHELIRQLNERVWPFVSIYHDFDVVGQFYGEFLKYTGGDKKALGIVLTPRHVADLFARLANLTPNSKVLDLCCGTGGFLISSMVSMLRKARSRRESDKIKRECLIGVEQQPNMFALAASNMILRGDGKANLYQGSCFDNAILAAVKMHDCDIGMINPPYSQKDEESRELVFVKTMLDCLTPGGTGIAIVPMSCAIKRSHHREELLSLHTLEAVMSMPGELFYPVGIVTCIMVFTAKRPHADSNRTTWFGYWKDDGFVKTKHRGRTDVGSAWPSIRDAWVDAFRNRDDRPGASIKRMVSATDEWCAEAYMETDYIKLSQRDFLRAARNYVVFNALGGDEFSAELDSEE